MSVVISVTMIVNEMIALEKETTHIKFEVNKYEKVADSFTIQASVITNSAILKRLNDLSNVIFWNAEGFVNTADKLIRYPSIVNEEGRSLEDKLILMDSTNLKREKAIVSNGDQLILIFPFYSHNLHYFLIPIKVKKNLRVSLSDAKEISLRNKYIFSIPLFSEIFNFYLLAILLCLNVITFSCVRYYRLRIEHIEKNKVYHNYTKLLMDIKDLKKELVSSKKRLYNCQSSLKISNTTLINQAINYVKTYSVVSEVCKNLPVETKVSSSNKLTSIYNKGIFSRKITKLDSIISKSLEIFKDNLQESKSNIILDSKGKGTLIGDEDFILSLMIMAISNILKTAVPSQTIKILTSVKEEKLAISFVGDFLSDIKDYKYPSFLEVTFSKNKKMTIKEIVIPSLIPTADSMTEKSKKNDNIVSLFNN